MCGRHEAIAFLARPFGVDCSQRVAIISFRASADPTEAEDNQGDERLLGHLPKETRARDTWQHVEAELKKAAAGGDTTQVSIALQMVLMLEGVEYRLKK